MNVKVTADSTCDLSPALLARYDITLAPLTVIKDGTSYADGLTITPQEIFSHVAAGGSLCSTAAALGANLLNLKPCIEVRDGKMQVVKKYRGPYAKCLANYVKDRLDGRPELRRDRLFITYTPVEPDCLAAVREAVDRYGHFREVFETSAGCTVSCHCGPGTLGVLFIRQ